MNTEADEFRFETPMTRRLSLSERPSGWRRLLAAIPQGPYRAETGVQGVQEVHALRVPDTGQALVLTLVVCRVS